MIIYLIDLGWIINDNIIKSQNYKFNKIYKRINLIFFLIYSFRF